MPKISTLGQKLWPTSREQTQKRPKTAKNGLKIAISRSNLKISRNKINVLYGFPKDHLCLQDADRHKTAKNGIKIAVSRSILKIPKNKNTTFEWFT